MTDNEIIKALECCSSSPAKCGDCPCLQLCDCLAVEKDALDLINRQKAEIEQLRKTILDGDFSSYTALKAKENWHMENSEYIDRLKEEIENQSENFKRLVAEHRKLQTNYSSMQSTLAKMSMGVEQAIAEAIKKFAERLKGEMGFGRYIQADQIDNLVKEMVGEG